MIFLYEQPRRSERTQAGVEHDSAKRLQKTIDYHQSAEGTTDYYQNPLKLLPQRPDVVLP